MQPTLNHIRELIKLQGWQVSSFHVGPVKATEGVNQYKQKISAMVYKPCHEQTVNKLVGSTNKWPCFCWYWMQDTVMLDWCTVGLQTVTQCVRAGVRISVWMSECVFASACAHWPVCVCACSCSACLAHSCAFAGACWCARGAPRRVGRATMPSGEEIECEVQYSLGPSSVAAAQQLVH